METLGQFTQAFFFYIRELTIPLLLGFLASGILYEFVPNRWVETYLGQKGFKPILITTCIGTLLPVCCFGSLPIAIAMRQKGARLGPVLAFLVTTPATSVSALLVCWKLLGVLFTVYIFFAVIIMGLVIGVLGNAMNVPAHAASEKHQDCCGHGEKTGQPGKTFFEKAENSFIYAFVTLPKEIGLALLLGTALASLIIIFQPAQHLIKDYLHGIFGYVFGLGFGLATYVCSTGDVPLADAFVKSGMAYGPAMTYLIAGPITSYGMMFAVKKEFGGKVLALYLGVICVLSLVLGMVFNVLVAGKIF